MRLEHSLQGRRSVADAHSHRTMGRHHNLRGRLRRDSCRPLLRDPAEKSAEKSAKNSAIFCEKIEIRELSSELRLLMSFSWLCFPGVIWTRFFSPHGFPGFWDSIPKRCKGVHCVDLGESFPTHIYLQKLASTQPRTGPSRLDS